MSRRNVRAPQNRPDGISQGEACRIWGVHERVLIDYEARGELVGIRIGNRVWYSRDRLIELLGPAVENTPDYPHRATLAAMVENLLADVEARALSPAVSRTA